MKLFGQIKNRLKELNLSYEERTMIVLAALGNLACLVAVIFDVLYGENIWEIFTLVTTMISTPIVPYIAIHSKKPLLGSIVQVIWVVFWLIPMIFFFGGGPMGGGVFWIIFAYMFIGTALSGKLRIVMMMCLTFVAVGAYFAWYLHPELVKPHTRKVFFMDSLVSVILVGIAIYVLFIYQKANLRRESLRAREEAARAEELNRAQNRFFSSMSHEIRTPINSILGLNEVILRREEASEEIKKDAENIQGAGKMLLSLINDILDFSKIEAGRMDIVPVDYKVSNMISEIVNMIWLRANDKGLEFNVDVDPSIPSVLFGDEVRIKQIIINLLNNAVKYTQAGSVNLHIESESTEEGRVQLLISVSDTGMGIRQEVLPTLFDAFKRVDQEKNRNIEGTGLGLSIVKQLTDLMDGEVSVNSVYGQGTTFTVRLMQEISNDETLGNINISERTTGRRKYENMFTAPDASILIVDDNEMNLVVEKKLLSETAIRIDTAMNGAEALDFTLKRHYDVILLDHLMPGMDGIECLERIRSQRGGLNAETPVIVLTANAGSENRELYNQSGFNGYLIKPVSGHQLEEMLLRFIPKGKLIISKSVQMDTREMNTGHGYTRKMPVILSAGSLSDIPEELQKKLSIDILPHTVVTDEGEFLDNVELSADEAVKYMETGKHVTGVTPEVSAYEEFFAGLLKRAHHVIYIALTTSMSDDFDRASRAARSFENVTVINSECMSSSLGHLLLAGYKLAQQNTPVDKIVSVLEQAKKRLRSGFVLGTTEYMAAKGLIGERVNRIAGSLMMRPSIRFSNDRYRIAGLWMGSLRHCYERYIRKTLSRKANPDKELLFVTYVSVPEEELVWIEEQIRKRVNFERIIFQPASAVVASYCGPGTFGLLYMEQGEQSYNLTSLLPKEKTEHQVPVEDVTEKEPVTYEKPPAPVEKEKAWYEDIEEVDGAEALKNNGTEESLIEVMKLFYNGIPEKASEIEGYYASEDWKNYTIKVHALKSSSKLVGAMGMSEDAQKLENAGKAGDVDYIREHHEALMQRLDHFREILKAVVESDPRFGLSVSKDRPKANPEMIKKGLVNIREAADEMDTDRIKSILAELSAYSLPDEEEERFAKIQKACDEFDYDMIFSLIPE